MSNDNIIEIEHNDYIVEISSEDYCLEVGNLYVSDYTYAVNKPTINGIPLEGDLSAADLGLTALSDKVTNMAEYVSDSQYFSAKCVKEEFLKKTDLDLNNLTIAGEAHFANPALANLAPEGEKHFLNKSQITNCILEAPHMVDLELENGVLTLKAGSKVIVPYGTSAPTMTIGDSLNGGTIVDISWDGSKLFYVIEYSNDNANAYKPNATFNSVVFLSPSGAIYTRALSDTFSSSTQPSVSLAVWYDTTNNIVKHIYNSAVEFLYCSLPFCIVNQGTSGYNSITQTFQHIGYIGATVWAMKGIKGLIPNGRNEDGTLKNIEYTLSHMSISEFLTSGDNDGVFRDLFYTKELNVYGAFYRGYTTYYQESHPVDSNNAIVFWINPTANKIYYKWGSQNIFTWTEISVLNLGKIKFTAGGIIGNFAPKEAFQVLERNDTEFIAHQSMPSDKYIDLTLGVTGTLYTAPADGYVHVSKRPTAAGQYLQLNSNVSSCIHSATSHLILQVYIPVRKGRTFSVNYSVDGATEMFRFVYAEGAV